MKPEALTAGAHSSESACWILASSAADVPVGMQPERQQPLLDRGVLHGGDDRLVEALDHVGGVLAGANTPYQPVPSMS